MYDVRHLHLFVTTLIFPIVNVLLHACTIQCLVLYFIYNPSSHLPPGVLLHVVSMFHQFHQLNVLTDQALSRIFTICTWNSLTKLTRSLWTNGLLKGDDIWDRFFRCVTVVFLLWSYVWYSIRIFDFTLFISITLCVVLPVIWGHWLKKSTIGRNQVWWDVRLIPNLWS